MMQSALHHYSGSAGRLTRMCRRVALARRIAPACRVALARRMALASALALLGFATIWTFRPAYSGATLVLYSAVGYAPQVVSAFVKQTGIPVTIIDMSTGPLLARVYAEGRRAHWSLVWFDGDAAATALDQSGLLAHGTIPALPWTKLGRSLLPADGAYTPTGITLAGVFSVRKDRAAETLDWNSLRSPAEAGKFGLSNPQLSGPAYMLLANLLQLHGGWPQGQEYLRELQQNGMRLYPTNPSTELALQTDQIDLAVAQSSAAYSLARHNPEFSVVLPPQPAILPSVIAVAANLPAKQRAEAEAFIRFAMSPNVQTLRMASNASDAMFWPVTTDAQVPAGLPALDHLPVTILNPAAWGAHEAAIGAWFDRLTALQ
jgi:iron(III) transport system substrate-binding protein